MTPRFLLQETRAGNRIAHSGAYSGVLQGREVRVRCPDGTIVSWPLDDATPGLRGLYLLQRIRWTAAIRDEAQLLD